ncbi:S-layer protein [Methanococcus maripaludis C5]|uniref:S-layer protein n=1 Tax=Methanococcus maripaludis (strain C5 / ATCC BAA-1333) TaxID=402880 RepID=A4FXR0_METM5|nr:S-layer protein [Methanococcus maripaludis]ABO34994.1 S-layer protein [Methanococcus maripaludis C5]
MAISIKKIVSIGIGGLMLGSAFCSGAFAVEKVGDVDSFVSDISTDNSNVDIIVGSNSVASDVVSAANIAAKIGSLSFLEQNGESASATLSIASNSKSDEFNLVGSGVTDSLFAVSTDDDYVSVISNADFDSTSNLDATGYVSLEDLGNLMEVSDTDPSSWFTNSDDDVSAEFLFLRLKTDGANWKVNSDEMSYMTMLFNENTFVSAGFPTGLGWLAPGRNIAYLGEEWTLMGLSPDADKVCMGKEVYRGTIKEGESYSVNGCEIKIDSIITDGAKYKVSAKILKDGAVIASTYNEAPTNLIAGGIGVRFQKVYESIDGNVGHADVVIVNNVKGMPLGSEVIPDYEIYTVVYDSVSKQLKYSDDFVKGQQNVGLALKYVGDDLKGLESDDKVKVADYADFLFDDEGSSATKLNVFFEMNEEKEVSLVQSQKINVLNAEIVANAITTGDKESITVSAPVVKLDTETSMDASENPLILIGGPIVNSITNELSNAGLIAIDGESLATLAVVSDVANGNDVLIVAGGDRSATTEAANALIEMI